MLASTDRSNPAQKLPPTNININQPLLQYLSGMGLTLYLTEAPFNTFANRADPDQVALLRVLPDQGLLCLLMEI